MPRPDFGEIGNARLVCARPGWGRCRLGGNFWNSAAVVVPVRWVADGEMDFLGFHGWWGGGGELVSGALGFAGKKFFFKLLRAETPFH